MTKKVCKFFTVDSSDKEERFLENMAQKGWQFDHLSLFIYHFKKAKPEKYAYAIDYKLNNNDEASYLQLFEDAGWENVYTYPILKGKWIYFRKKATSESQKEYIFTDKQSFIQLWRKVRSRWTNFGLLGILFILLIGVIEYTFSQFYIGTIMVIMAAGLSLLYGKMYIKLTRKIRSYQTEK